MSGSTGECIEGGDQILKLTLLKAVRFLWSFWWIPLEIEILQQFYLHPALQVNTQGNTSSLLVIFSLPRRQLSWRPEHGLPPS